MRLGLSLFAVSGLLAGCPGEAPDNPGTQADAAEDAAEITALQMTGTVMDYFAAATPVTDAMIATDGLDPPQMATSASDGGYALEIAVGSKLFVLATKNGYRPTRNMAVTVEDMSITQDIYLTSTQDVANQYTSVGATPTAGTAFLAAELRRNNAEPLDGIPLTNIQLLDAQNQPVAGIKGPYVFNAAGNLDMSLTMAMTYSGRSRIAILDVPAGTHTLVVTYPNNSGGTQTNNTLVTTTSDGTTLTLSGSLVASGGGGAVTDPTFATDIYPKLQRAAAGGLGCANCHTLQGSASFLKYDDPAATVLANLMARPGAINTTTPADSLLLTKPLYEAPPAPQNHPNATFIDINDPNYKLFLLWIMNGAKP